MIEIDDVELLDYQSKNNLTIIPIKTPTNYKLDFLTLKKGFELGLVEVKELENSTVNTLIVKNKSVTPLLLIEGEEIIGGDQNRIVNSTIVIAGESEMKIPVNCTEQGRWGYKHEFKDSDYIANSRTRFAKSSARSHNMDEQAAVWNSVKVLESQKNYYSPTQAMSENYDNAKTDLKETIEGFEIVKGQTGVLIIINGEVKGFEVFFNPEIYRQFHEKILKSYLIDSTEKKEVYTVDTEYAKSIISAAIECEYAQKDSVGLEECFEFANDDGIGSLYAYKEEVVHWTYLIGKTDFNAEEWSEHDGVSVTL
ncbi:ARPP-1 family domain-containing protein [Methanobrevibacter sp.]|uniref:ARPP-1 family domain-containing protein n=1 Tax=Methanobrevibacter sp. TaxID=66852 RepID=UPI003890C1FA